EIRDDVGPRAGERLSGRIFRHRLNEERLALLIHGGKDIVERPVSLVTAAYSAARVVGASFEVLVQGIRGRRRGPRIGRDVPALRGGGRESLLHRFAVHSRIEPLHNGAGGTEV